MPDRKPKRPNAHKHGAYAKTTILPGEDPREFEELHSALIEEWKPIGPTEEDAVFSIAKSMWRKRRVQSFLEAEVLKCIRDPEHPAYDPTAGLRNAVIVLEPNPSMHFEGHMRVLARLLPAQRIAELQRKFPQQGFKTPSEWAQAVKNEITSVLLPAVERLGDMPDEVLITLSAAAISQDLFKHELALDERLDAMIDRAIKRLIQTKALKQMLDHPSRTGRDDEPKAIQNRKPDGATAR